MASKKYFIGTCVDNPFGSVDVLSDIIDTAKEISKTTFLKNCEVDKEVKAQMRQFPRDFTFYKKGGIYFFTWSMIEHFFR